MPANPKDQKVKQPLHLSILSLIAGLNPTDSASVHFATAYAMTIVGSLIPPQHLRQMTFALDDQVSRLRNSGGMYAFIVANALEPARADLKQRLDESQAPDHDPLLAAIGKGGGQHGVRDDDFDHTAGHGKGQIGGGHPIGSGRTAADWLQDDSHRTGTDAVDGRGYHPPPFNRDGDLRPTTGCPFATGPAARGHRLGAADPNTIADRGFGRPDGAITGQGQMPGMAEIGHT